jgi:hypothetical protein
LGNFETFYVILSECVGAMPMVPPLRYMHRVEKSQPANNFSWSTKKE